MFILSLSQNEMRKYVEQQLSMFFPDNNLIQDKLFTKSFQMALERTEYCFKYVELKAYNSDDSTFFSHLHADQYTQFLWFLSNSVWNKYNDKNLANKIFYLNKILNGFMCMYNTELPDIFLVLHGNGTVLGKAKYSNFFVCHHGCTVGAVHGTYPTFDKGVAMAPQSIVVGGCNIGNNVTIGTRALVRNKDIPNCSIFYQDTETGKTMIKSVQKYWAQSFFNVPITDGDK